MQPLKDNYEYYRRGYRRGSTGYRKVSNVAYRPLHALAVLGEEYGELTKAMLQLTYEPHKTTVDEVRMEAVQTAAMALRLALSLDRYEYRRGYQHVQSRIETNSVAKEQKLDCGNRPNTEDQHDSND